MTYKEFDWTMILDCIGEAVIATDLNGKINYMNSFAEKLTGWKLEEVLEKPLEHVFKVTYDDNKKIENIFQTFLNSESVADLLKNKAVIIQRNGKTVPINFSGVSIKNEKDKVTGIVIVFRDDSERRQHDQQLVGLLEGARSVLKTRDFLSTAKSIFDTCKRLIGASAGYVALLSDDGAENKVLFLDSGGSSCTVDPNLPMPIRGLRETAYREHRTVYENDFFNSDWVKFMPKGHVNLRNVMFAPLIIEGKAVGLIGLANKKSDFSDRDALIASSFGEYAALALNNSWTLSSIEKQKKSADFINDKLKVVGSLTRHDVRNKLFLIKSKTYLFKKKPDNSPEVLKFLEGLDSIVDSSIDLLDFSSLYEKIGIDELRTVNVGEYFDQAIGLMNPKCIEVINETYSLNVIADALLSKVFYNLLDNSLKHGKKVTRIRLSHKIEKGSLKLIYEDNGVGVAETDKSKIFSDGFSTGNGSGLGLKLIKRIIEYYGWKITEAGESNKGAKFIITIPKFHEQK